MTKAPPEQTTQPQPQRVWIAQCLCPQRHCILASGAEAPNESAAKKQALLPLQEAIEAMLQSGEINPWCGICYAPTEKWHYEVGCTAFATLTEAMPTIRQTQAANVATGALIGEVTGASKHRGRA
jgi:hypothetical protein